MRNRIERVVAVALTASSVALAACGHGDNRQVNTSRGDVASPTPGYAADTAATAAPKHHSKLAGAAMGAVAGHMLGGHAVAGAAAGAIIQHERNKHNR